jgi:hypothetical protein
MPNQRRRPWLRYALHAVNRRPRALLAVLGLLSVLGCR